MCVDAPRRGFFDAIWSRCNSVATLWTPRNNIAGTTIPATVSQCASKSLNKNAGYTQKVRALKKPAA